VLLVHHEPQDEAENWTPAQIRAHVTALVEEGFSRRDAVMKTAADLRLPRNAVYEAATGGGDEP
jgi:hypothetical protein